MRTLKTHTHGYHQFKGGHAHTHTHTHTLDQIIVQHTLHANDGCYINVGYLSSRQLSELTINISTSKYTHTHAYLKVIMMAAVCVGVRVCAN